MVSRRTTPGSTRASASKPAAEQADASERGERTERPASRRGQSSFSNLREAHATPLRRTPAAENIKKMIAAFKEYCGEAADQYRFLILDKQAINAGASAIVIATTVRRSSGELVGLAHPLLIEASIEGVLLPLNENIGGRSYEVRRVTGDIYDDYYWTKVEDAVAAQLGVKEVFEAGQDVIPVELAADDEERLNSIMYAASIALKTVADKLEGVEQFSISVDELNPGERLVGRIDLNPALVETSTGLPIRSDIALHLSGQSPNEGQRSAGQSDMTDLMTVDTFVNLVYEPPKRESDETQHYLAEIVATNMDVKIGMPSLEFMMLGVNALGGLGKQMNYAMAFRQRVAQNDPLRDLSAVGFDIPDLTNDDKKPMRVPDFTSASFTQRDFLDLVGDSIRSDVVLFSIDIPELGPMSVLNAVLEAAAQGREDANNALIAAADRLTGGRFSRVYDGGPLVKERIERISCGYYIDRNGERCDLRKLDYLAMLNILGETDMEAVEAFDATFDPRTDLAIRLIDREDLLVRARPEAVFKSYVRRYSLTDSLMFGLDAAMESSGNPIAWINSPENLTNTGRRRPGSMSSLGVNMNRMGSLYSGRRESNSSLQRRDSRWQRGAY